MKNLFITQYLLILFFFIFVSGVDIYLCQDQLLNIDTQDSLMGVSNKVPFNAFKESINSYNKHNITSKYIIIIDFDLPSTSRRLWIINTNLNTIVLNTYVTHGRNSGDLYATSFSNAQGSLKSSLGAYITTTHYMGSHGESIHVRGLDRGINNNAERRAIEIHSASYIGNGRTGTSWGCFAVPIEDMKIINKLINYGTFIYAYHR